MSEFSFISPRRDGGITGGWSRQVEIAGVTYWVGITRGKRVRIPYKPRGPEGFGWKWHGYVRDAKGHELWSGEVGKSLGARGMLRAAGLLASGPFHLLTADAEDPSARRRSTTTAKST